MTTNIRDRIEEFSNAQLDAVIEVLEPFDIEEWDEESAEYGLCDDQQDVENALIVVQ